MRQDEYRRSLESQIKNQQTQYMGIVGSSKDQDQQFIQSQWKAEQERIKREKGISRI